MRDKRHELPLLSSNKFFSFQNIPYIKKLFNRGWSGSTVDMVLALLAADPTFFPDISEHRQE